MNQSSLALTEDQNTEIYNNNIYYTGQKFQYITVCIIPYISVFLN